MSPRPAPDLQLRRDLVIRTARALAEAEGWTAVTTRRLAGEMGVTQPVLYSAFANRQAIIDAVAIDGYAELADMLQQVEASPLDRMRAYLRFAGDNPQVYEAMFSLPSGLTFASDETPAPLREAFTAIRDAFPDKDGTWAEVAWSTLHGLADLLVNGRLRPASTERRIELAHRMLTQLGTPPTPDIHKEG